MGSSETKRFPFPGGRTTADGSGMVVWVESHISQGACAYPITPSTPMGDGYQAEVANGKKNLWGEQLKFLEPESEHSSASACEGFAAAGGRVSNFTSGQGLILMKEVLYVIAGKRLPVVFHIGARALTSHSLNVHCSHDDMMGVADCGWGMLFARNAQEAGDFALIARRAAEDSETPFFNVQDGFLTTHTIESVLQPEPEMMKQYLGKPEDKLRRIFDPETGTMSGVVQNQDSYMKGKIAQRWFYDRVPQALANAFEEFYCLTGRRYDPVMGYRLEDADYVLVGMGSMMDTARATIDYMRAHLGAKVGVLAVIAFRPFPGARIVEALKGAQAISVIERMDDPLAQSNALTREIKAAFAEAMNSVPGYPKIDRIPQIFSGSAGMGSRDVRPGDFVGVVQNMRNPKGRRYFALGIKHELALPRLVDPDVRPRGAFSMRGHSVGGYGSVTTNKVIASLASDLFGLHCQAYPKYGSEKKGIPTTFYLTLADEPVLTHCELVEVDFIALQDSNALKSSNPLNGLREGGAIFLQHDQTDPGVIWETLPGYAQEVVRNKQARLFALDAWKIARAVSSRADLQVRMQGIILLGAFLRITPFQTKAGLNEEQLFAGVRRSLEKYFGRRGAQVVEDNLLAVKRGYSEPIEVLPPEMKPEEVGAGTSQKLGGTFRDGGSPRFHAEWGSPVNPNPDSPAPEDHLAVPILNTGEFYCRVLDAYNRGIAEEELPADLDVARSLIPPATGALRDFSYLSPEIPRLDSSKCVGCMDCVTQCPDTAILARAIYPEELDQHLARLADEPLRNRLRQQFATTTKYFDTYRKKGQKGGLFGIFVDPTKCKGCAECITACGEHDALSMIRKDDKELEWFKAAFQFFRSLPDTPKALINEKALGDMMLAERSLLFVGGAGSCMGCGEATIIRMMLAATGFIYGRDSIGIVAATGCNTVYGSTYPYNPFQVAWTNSLFENAPPVAMGIRMRWDQMGWEKKRIWAFGGDGAMLDIGFQGLSRMFMSGMDIKVLVLDTQVYSNTGGQASSSTYLAQNAKMSAVGTTIMGKTERRKELSQIAMMHPGVFVAQTSPALPNHFYRAVLAANEYPGPAVINCYAACQPEHGIGDDMAYSQAKLAVESRAFPVFLYDPRKGEKIRERLSLMGNLALKEDWYKHPKTGEPIDFVCFARTEGRFAKHFDAQGNPSEALKAAQADRLANWHLLQELAGLR